ncbi:ribosomal protein S18-alanine N-acetyltransferase [Sulfuriflexus mobilis]|uniref:ribosomal protein S18-alanine N-acetyltransferase n=1 Tax=Sulfuriflexus mobilis TaxID=1811807 RepID=UPI001E64FC8B|nr:ribosomal protein S18-alanine N-acetyltransferase [Sulfuriflexus mobilis]
MSAILQAVPIRLRPMRETDIDAVIAIENAIYPFPWTEGIMRDCLRVGYCCWLAVQEEQVVGYCIMSIGAGESHLLNICIHRDWQRQGVASQLMKNMLNIARRHGAETCLLEVRPSNIVAIELYEKLGFSQVGLRKAYYPAENGHEDALILAYPLSDYEE